MKAEEIRQLTQVQLSERSVAELRDMLRALDRPVSGRKDDLVQRILNDSKPALSIPPDVEQEAREVTDRVIARGKSLVIDSQDAYEAAARYLTENVNVAIRMWDEAFDPIAKDFYNGHKRTLATKRKITAPLIALRDTIKAAMLQFHRQLEEKQREERRALLAAQQDAVEQATVEKALELMGDGREEEAERMLSELADGDGSDDPALPVPAVQPHKPTASGTAVTRKLKFNITDPSQVKRPYCSPDSSLIRMAITTYGMRAVEEVGGIEVFEDLTLSATTKRR